MYQHGAAEMLQSMKRKLDLPTILDIERSVIDIKPSPWSLK